MSEGATCAPGQVCSCHVYNAALFAFLAHDIEELTGLVGWISAQGFPLTLTQPQFANAVVWLLVLAGLVLIAGRMAAVRPVQLAVAFVGGAFLANVASHVILSLATWSYMPGTGTALALLFPASLYLMRRLPLVPRDRNVAGAVGAILMAPITWLVLWLAG